MAAFPAVRRATASLLIAIGCITAFSSCATTQPPGRTGAVYRVAWTASRTSDHAPLASGSVRIIVGGSATTRLHSQPPTEDKPTFTRFTARLTATRTAGLFQLVTRADMREATRNKKGKLKIAKRNIGALLPIRAGETQVTNTPSDPVHVEVRLERE